MRISKKTLVNSLIGTTVLSMPMSALAEGIEEVIVTATKRAESAQDIPVTVQAFNGKAIKDLNVSSFDEYSKYLPNISRAGRGPGQNEIFIRGQAVDSIKIQLAEAQGTAPNVALYLDEQPLTTGGRNMDLYVTDIERIEVLAGPQGTLFGASSQAGTVRLITNKPNFDEFDAGIEFGLSDTKSGDMSNSVEAFLNIPLIDDKLAVRVAAYNDNKGGYIDNVPGVFSLDRDLVNANAAFALQIAPNAPLESANNIGLVEDNFNESSYQGGRFGIKYAINDDWTALVQHTAQTLDVDGVFDYDPAVGDLQVQRYADDRLKDNVNLTTWTLSGRAANLDLIYTGGFVDRDVDQNIDYTGYNNKSAFVAYYICNYNFYTSVASQCYDPVKALDQEITNTRQTHELRFSTDPENRWRITAGVYFDETEIEVNSSFKYFGAIDVQNSAAPTWATQIINVDQLARAGSPDGNTPATLTGPDVRELGEIFINDITRREEQIAVFGEFSYDITDQFTGTIGLRYYNLDVEMDGFTGSIFVQNNLDTRHDTLSAHDLIPKFTISYKPTEDLLLYTTYSEGFRPPGFNRSGGQAANNPAFNDVPVSFGTDDVENIEFGWKSTWLGGNLRFNGAIYSVEWTDIQVPRFDPINVGIPFFIDNGLDADIFGVEADVAYAVTDNLTLFGAVSYNDTEVVSVLPGTNFETLLPLGSPLPTSPELQGNVRARYEREMFGFDAFAQIGFVYADSSVSALLVDDRLPQDSYVITDLSFGVSKENWGMTFYIENATDERAELHYNTQDDIPRITTNRPRTFGLRFSYQLN